MKRFLYFVIAISYWLSASAYSFMADDIAYSINNDNKSVSVTSTSSSSGYNYNYSGVTSVNIPSSVTYNGKKYSVTSILAYAFKNAMSIKSIIIPYSITYIGSNAFENCDINTVVYNAENCSGPSIYAERWFNNKYNTLIIGNGVKTIPKYLAYEQDLLTTVAIPNSVRTIAERAFFQCSGMRGELSIPNSVTTIGDEAFYYCHGLTSLTIGNSVTSIGREAFYNCVSLTDVTIGESVKTIGHGAFIWCQAIKNIVYNAENCSSPTTEDEAFFYYASQCTSLTFGDKVKVIPAYLAHKKTKITAVNIPNSVTTIGDYAFAGCSRLTSANFPNSVTTIGDYAFSECTMLSDTINVSNALVAIGNGAFYNCSKIKGSLLFSNNLTSIGKSAFSGCSSLSGKIIIPESVTSIGSKALYGCSGITSLEYNAENCSGPNDDWFSGCRINQLTYGAKVRTIPAGLCFPAMIIVGTTNSTSRFDGNNAVSELYSLNTTPPIIEGTSCLPSKTIKLFVNKGCAEAYRNAYGWENFSNIIDGILVKSISLCKDKTTLKVGMTEQLTASVMPEFATDKFLVWSSSNSNVATVSATGIVTAKAVGDANITASTTDGSDLTASCAITVYDPMVNFFEAEDVRIHSGYTNATIGIGMSNENAISAFQCDIYLPEHTSVAYDEEEDEYNFTLAPERKTSTHTITANNLGNGHYRIMCASSKSANFKLSEGTLFNINLDIDEYLKVGNYEIRITDIVLYENDGQTCHNPADIRILFTVDDYELGDANGDDVIDVGDVVSVINYTLGKPDSGIFIMKAADANQDGIINVGDVITIFNRVLNNSK